MDRPRPHFRRVVSVSVGPHDRTRPPTACVVVQASTLGSSHPRAMLTARATMTAKVANESTLSTPITSFARFE